MMRFSAASSCSCSVRRASLSARHWVVACELKFSSMRAQRVDFVGELEPCAFKASICLARQFEVFTQLFDLRLECGCPPFDLVELRARGPVGRAGFGEHARQVQSLRFFRARDITYLRPWKHSPIRPVSCMDVALRTVRGLESTRRLIAGRGR